MIITLIGYMGSGKSFIGEKLSAHLNLPFTDLDSLIEEKENKKISEIFKEKGELYFRKLEYDTLKKTLDQSQNIILSLGGGTPCFYNSMELINQKSYSFYLQNKIQTLVDRLKTEKQKRPIITHLNDDQLPEFIAKHLFERRLFYEKALFTIKTDEYTIDDIMKNIQEKIH